MDDSGPELAKQVAALAESLRSVEARLAALEGAAAPALPPPGAAPVPAGVPSAATEPALPSIAALAGRCLFVLAGAFLVRALTDSGAFPRGAGVALGLAYALTWLVLADGAGRAGSAAAATAWGVTALVIACPLVWEASTRFQVLRPAAAAGVLLAVGAIALAASVHRNLRTLAWAAVLSVLATTSLLLVTTHALVPFGAVLVVLTAGAWAASTRHGWAGLAWLPAVVADLAVLEAIWIASRPGGLPEAYAGLSPGAILVLALVLPAAPLAGVVWRARRGDRAPDVFEGAQAAAALLIALFAASRLSATAGLPREVLAAGFVALAASLYGAALRAVGASSGMLSAFALALLLAASGLAIPPRALGLVWGAAGFAAVAAPLGTAGAMAGAHGAVLLLAAAAASGLVGFARHAFLGSPVTGLPAPDSLVVLALSAAATALLARRLRAGAGGRAVRGAMFALACVSIVGAGALAVRGLALLVAPDGDPGRIAAARGAVLAAASVLLASCRRLPTLSPLSRLAYPVLAAAGLKLLLEDLPHGRPSTLVATFVLYGAALMVVPRTLRSRRA
jgi:hypothetical protein